MSASIGAAGPLQRSSTPRRGDHDPGPAGMLERALVARGEVHPVGIAESRPLQLIAPQRRQPLPERDDRALTAVVEQRHRPPRGFVAPGHVRVHAMAPQPLLGVVTEAVVAQRAEEVDLGAEPGERHRHDAPAPAGAGERIVGVEDLAGRRKVLHRDEVDPLDVADHGDARHRGGGLSRPATAPRGTGRRSAGRPRPSDPAAARSARPPGPPRTDGRRRGPACGP